MINPLINDGEKRFRAGMRLIFYIMLVVLGLGALLMASAAPGKSAFYRYGLGPLILGCTWLAAKAIDRRPLSHFGLENTGLWWKEAALGLGSAAALAGLVFLAALGSGSIRLKAFPGPGFGLITLIDAGLTFASMALWKELMFRSYLIRTASEGLGFIKGDRRIAPLIAWAASALAYALLPQRNPEAGILSALLLFSFGLLLGLPFLFTGRLGLSLGFNLGWNLFLGAIFGFPVSGTEYATSLIDVTLGGKAWFSGSTYGPEAGLLGLLAILLGGAALCLWQRKKAGTWFDFKGFVEGGAAPGEVAPTADAGRKAE